MATFHENLKQSFKNFKNKYIGNVPSGVTLAQINADLIDLRRNGAMPNLNYTTPLHTFSSNNLSYTATKECYLCGTIITASGTSINVSVNNKIIYRNTGGASYPYISPLKINAGDVVTVSGNPSQASLFIFDTLQI